MPRIYDNIEFSLLPALQNTLEASHRADFCVGYFNLYGWRQLDKLIEPWIGGPDACCRLLIGMQKLPHEEVKSSRSLLVENQGVDRLTAIRLKRQMAEEFRSQLTLGAPSNADEIALRRLSAQLKARKVVVKLFLRHQLHAKLYLLYRKDYNNPITGFLGSSNLTLSGLAKQGELNLDVLEQDACLKLEKWFNDRWEDPWCLDISDDLAQIINNSWAREELIPPYYIYLKMAYHLSQEARAGLAEYNIPRVFRDKLLDFQAAAVQIAANHLNKRNGVLIGDVVGLGKTMMASALARIFQDDHGMDTLVICPKNLVKMWQDYADRFWDRRSEILPISQVTGILPELRLYRLVIIDESHNLRNREGKRYRAIQEYIERNDSKCILLTATPYNKTFLDLSAQLRLFVPEGKDIGIRPEKLISAIGQAKFDAQYQAPPRSLAAFEKSEYIDDWRELMRLYMVRRTRSFIIDNYSKLEPATERRFLTFADGSQSFFPRRVPRTLKFKIAETSDDPYYRLYDTDVVEAINSLQLPRYGLGSYSLYSTNGKLKKEAVKLSETEKKLLENLGRAGQRLKGFSRTNLFKRLESGGPAFIQSIERHILRNYIFLHAIEHNLDIPLGTQEAELLDPRNYDEDSEIMSLSTDDGNEPDEGTDTGIELVHAVSQSEATYQTLAAKVYANYAINYKRRFKWLRSSLFNPKLKTALLEDARTLLFVRAKCGTWAAATDTKLAQLVKLLTELYPNEKVLIFSQFADTVRYLLQQLQVHQIAAVEAVTGETEDPTAVAWRFSPDSNGQRAKLKPEQEIRVLVSTDVLSEGQNLQDAAIVVNYDLPWAIIRLIQRAGRVDRIGQKAAEIVCYTFLPAAGVEKIIRLRSRLRHRLKENAEVVGTDETFFEDDADDQVVVNIYNEKAGILDDAADSEVDLGSYAFQIWKNATDANPKLKDIIPGLPDVVFSTRPFVGTNTDPEGVLLYVRTSEGNDALARVNQEGVAVTESQFAILKVAQCSPDTKAIVRYEGHHELVEQAIRQIAEEEKSTGGRLGRSGGARYRTYHRLKDFADNLHGTLFENLEENQILLRTIDQIYKYPLRQSASDTLNRQLKSSITDEALKQLVILLYQEDRLCLVQEDGQVEEPRIICSLGLFNGAVS